MARVLKLTHDGAAQDVSLLQRDFEALLDLGKRHATGLLKMAQTELGPLPTTATTLWIFPPYGLVNDLIDHLGNGLFLQRQDRLELLGHHQIEAIFGMMGEPPFWQQEIQACLARRAWDSSRRFSRWRD